MVKRVWQTLDEPRRKNILGLISLIAFLLIFLSLLTYSPDDLSANRYPPNETIKNVIGYPGAFMAQILLRSLGYMAWLIPFLFLGWFIFRFRQESTSGYLHRLIGIVLLIISSCTLLHMLFSEVRGEEAGFQAGGFIGTLCSIPFGYFGFAGAYLILIALLFIALILSTEFLFSKIFMQFKTSMKKAAEKRRMKREERLVKKAEKAEAKEIAKQEKLQAKEEKKQAQLMEKQKVKIHDTKQIEIDIIEEETLENEPKIQIAQTGKTAVKEIARFKGDDDLSDYEFPSITLLDQPVNLGIDTATLKEEIHENTKILEQTLSEFDIKAHVTDVFIGPVITRYEVKLPPGIKVNKVVTLADNLALALRSPGHVRILAPIPGKGAVGIEVPNKHRAEVFIREVFSAQAYEKNESVLKIALGKTIDGDHFVTDLAKMPHLLLAGATGSGKSVCLNTIIVSMLYNARPDQVKFLMIDPKRVEFSLYRDIPHLLSPVVTDVKQAAAALKWVIIEMEARYNYLSKLAVRDIKSYNKKMKQLIADGKRETVSEVIPDHLPYIIVLIDELADLMMIARADIEVLVARLAQMARAVGIHLVIATQRPSVNVITGVIKANFPTRIAFQVSSKVDSRTILDTNGAEALLGRGDLLFSSGGAAKPIRIQGSLINSPEIERVTDMIKEQSSPNYLKETFESDEEETLFDNAEQDTTSDDNLYRQAKQLVLETGSASTSLLQRRLQIGYGRAARMLDRMEDEGIVGPPRGSKPREVIRNLNP